MPLNLTHNLSSPFPHLWLSVEVETKAGKSIRITTQVLLAVDKEADKILDSHWPEGNAPRHRGGTGGEDDSRPPQ